MWALQDIGPLWFMTANCDFDLKINVGHSYLYFTVQWFCLVSWRLFDGWMSGLWIMSDTTFDLKINEPQHDKTNKMTVAPSEDSDQPGHLPSLIRVFAVGMMKPRALSYPLNAQWRLIRLGDLSVFAGCPDHFVGFVMLWLKYRWAWPIFHGTLILSYFLKAIWWMNIKLWDYESVMQASIELIMSVGRSDPYFTVQWFLPYNFSSVGKVWFRRATSSCDSSYFSSERQNLLPYAFIRQKACTID